jgi:hypothetical protein
MLHEFSHGCHLLIVHSINILPKWKVSISQDLLAYVTWWLWSTCCCCHLTSSNNIPCWYYQLQELKIFGVISKGIMLAQNEAVYEPWITTQIYSSLISHMQYVLTVQGHHQVSVTTEILQKNLNFYDFFKNFIHQRKECDLILTKNFVVTYNFIKVFL